MVPERTAAKTVTFTATDESFRKFLLLIYLGIIGVGLVEFSHFTGVELVISLLEFCQAIDILLWLDSIWSIGEPPLLAEVEWLIYLIKLDFRFLSNGRGNQTFTHKDRVVLVAVLDFYFAVFYVAYPFGGMPVEGIYMVLLDVRTKNLQFVLGKLLVEFKDTSAILLIDGGITFGERRLIDIPL